MTDLETRQETRPEEAPGPEHGWLRRLLGDWTYDLTVEGASGPEVFAGTETFRAIGDYWVQGIAEGETPDDTRATNVMTLGFDPGEGRFVGTFITSQMTNLWIYSGSLDPDRRRLTLESIGPDFESWTSRRNYRDVIEFLDDDHRTLTALVERADGSWEEMMTVHYRRVT